MDPQDRTNDDGNVARTREADEPAPDSPARDRQITMFNRKAIVVLASIAGMTVMVVSFAFNTPKRSTAPGYGDATPAEQVTDDGVRRNYLSAPPDTGRMGFAGGALPDVEQQGAGSLRDQAAGFVDVADGFNPANGSDFYDPYGGSAYASQPWLQEPAAPPPPDEPSARELAFERAMRCGIRSCPPEPSSTGGPSPDVMSLGFDGGLMMPEVMPAQGTVSPAEPPAAEPRDRHQAFLQAAGEGSSGGYVASSVQRPVSPYQIMAGTLIPATLVTAINSDLPGEVVAQVTRNVYDTQQRHLLIPAGSRLLGRVDNQVGLGQARLNIAWHRLIFPNNNSLALPGFGGVDAQGAAGIRDRVNNHVGRTYLNGILLSAITAGAQLSQPQSANIYAAPTAGQVAAGALGQQMGEVSSEMVRRNMEVGPTLEVRPGFTFSIYVSQDLILSPYNHYGED